MNGGPGAGAVPAAGESGAGGGCHTDRGHLGRRRAAALLALLLAASGVLYAVGITWGLPSWNGWSADELHPDSWQRAIDPETPTGWHARYPPLHFRLLHTLASPLRQVVESRVVESGAVESGAVENGAVESGAAEADRFELNLWLTLMARGVSLLMALATLFVVYRLGRRLAGGGPAGRRSGLFAVLVLAPAAPWVYYAKTANLEAPYLLWLALSLLAYVRLLEAPRLRDAVLFGLAAAAAVATKDQAYAVYALAPLPLLASLAARRPEPSRLARWLRAAVDRRFLAAGAAAVAGYAVLGEVVFNRGRFTHHVELLLGPMSGPYREFGHGPGDQLQLAGRFLVQVVFALDPLLFAACIGGIAWLAVRAWRERRQEGSPAAPIARPAGSAQREAWLTGSLLLLAVSYYLTLIAVIGFTFDRYVLPVCLILALPGGRGFGLLVERLHQGARVSPARRRLATAAIAAVFVYGALYGASVDARMLADSRYRVEAYVAERSGGDTRDALAIGRTKHVPRFRRLDWPRVHRSHGAVLRRQDPRFVAINLTDLRSRPEAAFVARLDRGELGYRRVLTVTGDPAFDLLGSGDIGTSQRFINPEIALWERLPEEERLPAAERTAAAQPSPDSTGDSGAKR